MKKLIISGSSKLQDRINYWHGFFEGQGYEVLDFPTAVPFDTEHASEITDIYTSYYQNLDRADVLFVMNEDKNGIEGYIGTSTISEITYVIVNNLNHGKKTEILFLQMPSAEQNCYEEVSFWLSQDWIKLYQRPGAKKALLKSPEAVAELAATTPEPETETDELDSATSPINSPVPPTFIAPARPEKTINILTCHKRCLKPLTPAAREYLKTIAPEFPAWLLKYIAAPEFQRLAGVGMTCGNDYSGLYNFNIFHSVFTHSIGVALLLWRFTHDKKQTLAGLFHDIASPAFKHCIDIMNDDAETQESIEERTAEIIRNSRTICRQLKHDEIMAGEVSDYRLYPLADNDLPNLAADRIEYTLSNGYFAYETWTLDQVKRFSDNLTVLKNEHNIDELGFADATIAKEFTKNSIPLFAEYFNDVNRANSHFIADIIKSMMLRDYLTMDDLYNMSEREIIDWILSCGDKTLSEAFRNFQRTTSVYNSSTVKKDRYCTAGQYKVRYTNPLTIKPDSDGAVARITEISSSTDRALQKFLDHKVPKYVGFDFEFTPYAE